MYKKLIGIILALTLVLGITIVYSCNGDKNIVELGNDDDQFSTLMDAVDAAGLTDILEGEGPFTVFAPTNDAFDALPEGTLDELLNDIPALTKVLQYHIVNGDYTEADLVEMGSVETEEGQSVTISESNGDVMVNDAMITDSDLDATNGKIQVIDQVLMPPDVMGSVAANENLDTFVTALEASGLDAMLKETGPFTVFVPNDDAFSALPEGTLTDLLSNVQELTAVLEYHIIADKLTEADLAEMTSAETLEGQSVTISTSDDSVMINDATIVTPDIEVLNGVIHVIDKVLIPEEGG